MDNKGFEDIEDFYSAYNARFKEYRQIGSLNPIPKILIMHWGGIVIETYVKYLLVRNKGAKKERSKLWYTLEKFNYIMSQGNLSKGNYPLYKCAENPQHSIEQGITQINFLNDLLTDDKKINDAINNVTYPLGRVTKNGFIDLRYVSPNQIINLDELFVKWNESFKCLLKWLVDNTKNIEVS
jgi:hypothetical protein